MNIYSKLPYSIKFLLLSVSAGILISFISLSYNFMQLQKNKALLDKIVNTCHASGLKNHEKNICNPSILSQLGAYQGMDNEIVQRAQLYEKTKSKIFALPLIIIIGFIIFGMLPTCWVFFLNRICDISNAIRGNKK